MPIILFAPKLSVMVMLAAMQSATPSFPDPRSYMLRMLLHEGSSPRPLSCPRNGIDVQLLHVHVGQHVLVQVVVARQPETDHQAVAVATHRYSRYTPAAT